MPGNRVGSAGGGANLLDEGVIGSTSFSVMNCFCICNGEENHSRIHSFRIDCKQVLHENL